MSTDYVGGERRSHRRYALELEVRYQVIGETRGGFGRTRDLSSGGVSFTAHRPLPMGRIVELTISWPVALEGSIPLNLVLGGTVVRGGAEAAIEIMHHEFRTRGKSTSPIATVPLRDARPIPKPPDAMFFRAGGD